VSTRAPYLLLTALIALALAGVTLLICGAVLNYGPLYTVGGIFIGFSYGFYLARQTMVRALRSGRRG
jgi:uncharacterized membrane protein YdjX (TVP38/TMEM64 family)